MNGTKIGDGTGQGTYQLLMLQCLGPLHNLVGWFCGPCCPGREGIFEMEVRGVEQDHLLFRIAGTSQCTCLGMDH